jgi:hypothetical protein
MANKLLLPRIPRLKGIRQPIRPIRDQNNTINRGLIGHWMQSGSSIGIDPDLSEFANDATITAGSSQYSHHGGTAMSFNGSSTLAAISQNDAILGAAPRSLSLWINNTDNTIRAIFSYGVATTFNFFALYINVIGGAGGDLYFASNGNDIHTGSLVIATNTWYHVVLTYNGGTLATVGTLLIYVNGVSQSLTTAGSPSSLATLASTINIGNDVGTAGRNWKGGLENVRWYNRVLDPVEVSQLYAEPYVGLIDITQWPRVGVAAAAGASRARTMMGVGL